MDSKLIQYNVTTRWNSSYCMLNDAWNAAPQIQEYLKIKHIVGALRCMYDREGKFKDFDTDVANASKSAMRKYDKYYTLIDDSYDILYITMFLDPQFKKLILKYELQDGAKDIITAMQEQLKI
ncbi:hypothetical protein TSTA_082850 [Talaromyces stipitatus ATCC 10500]|uniref:hAT-like transposase RNase-H fold domain-containing protein n=1 Tax=Talaromyces stipitatus (strain ATCC 10500 / CBS 375.48 / QM 6759 / NRRL 1006) TaxID=441959 RepID=B8M1B0_TALSN|nr:uncharacterized protein TSTA_082850 [Talaromyces stipitatus ATCC 10500]EED21052.1 hypothetical protein TSTA_082850 [Talaromyces stipitatus ATCC 10500]